MNILMLSPTSIFLRNEMRVSSLFGPTQNVWGERNGFGSRGYSSQQYRKKSKHLRIILTKSLDNIGEKGEEIQVKKGYARNYLFPRQLAVYSMPQSRKEYANDAANIDYEARARRNNLLKARKRINKIILKVKRQRVEFDRLHSPVDAKTIATQLWRQCCIWLPPEKIFPENGSIESYGTHKVKLLLGEEHEPEAHTELTVNVLQR